MAAFDFPPTPAVGTLYPLVAEVGKPQYRWNGTEWTAATFDPAGYVRKSGDAMTGALSLAGDPTQALHAVPKQYIDTRRQVVSLAGNAQIDVQVPSNAITARLIGEIRPATFFQNQPVIQVSVEPGVFLTSGYTLNGFYQNSNTNAMQNYSANVAVIGYYLGVHDFDTIPLQFDSVLTLRRPTTTHYFCCMSRTAHWSAGVLLSGFYSGVIAPLAGLQILALRMTTQEGTSIVWDADSRLQIEWIY